MRDNLNSFLFSQLINNDNLFFVKKILLSVCFFIFFSFALFAKNTDYFENSTWLCIEDISSGFNWNKDTKKWMKVNYRPTKHIFKTTKDELCGFDNKEEYKYVVGHVCGQIYDFGDDPSRLYNYYEVLDSIDGLSINGNENMFTFYDFKMSSSGNFILSFNIPGNVNDIEIKDSMALSIGKCSKL